MGHRPIQPARIPRCSATGRLERGQTLLGEIGAIDDNGRITEEGRKLRALPLPPRLARMVVDAAAQGAGEMAAAIAAILTERGLGGNDVDLGHRLENFRRDRARRAEDARAMVGRWAATAGNRQKDNEQSPGALLALAYPDRVARKSRRQWWCIPACQRPRRNDRPRIVARARNLSRCRRARGSRGRPAASFWRPQSRLRKSNNVSLTGSRTVRW